MIHYTCDRCKSVIDSAQRTRYIVHVEVHSVEDQHHEPEDSGDVDSLSLLHQMLEGIESQPITTDDGDGETLHCEETFPQGLDVDDRTGGIRKSAEIDPSEDISDDQLPTHRAHYDLCPACYRVFLRNPLAKDLSLALHFSKN